VTDPSACCASNCPLARAMIWAFRTLGPSRSRPTAPPWSPWVADSSRSCAVSYCSSAAEKFEREGWRREREKGNGKPASEQPGSRDRRWTTAARCGHAPSPLRIFAPEPVFRHQRQPQNASAREYAERRGPAEHRWPPLSVQEIHRVPEAAPRCDERPRSVLTCDDVDSATIRVACDAPGSTGLVVSHRKTRRQTEPA
jgi:hypothetical protein